MCQGIDEAYGVGDWNPGDIITTTLIFENGKGSLRFGINGHDYYVAFPDLKPPLYPMAWMYHCTEQISIVD